MSNELQFMPKWVGDSMADDCELGADGIERIFGPCESADELRRLAADLRGETKDRAS